MKYLFSLSIFLAFTIPRFSSYAQNKTKQPVHQDKPFTQDYSIKYYADTTKITLSGIAADRNGIVQILSDKGLQRPFNGKFLYHGSIELDHSYRFMKDKKISAISSYKDQLVYLTDKVV